MSSRVASLRLALLPLVILFIGHSSRLPAASWPQFHGPNGDNMSTETGLLKQWPEDGPPLLWTADGIGQGYASVSVSEDGVIYTAGNIDGQTVVTALDLDGEVIWRAPCGEAWTGSYPGTRSTPTIDGDRLYYETPVGDVVCLDRKSGNKVWGRNILEDFAAQNIKWALAESVLIDGDHAICSPFGEKASIVGLNKYTGETAWAAEGIGEKAGYATPTIVDFAGMRLILTMSAKSLVGVNADTAEVLFTYEHITKYDVNALKPIFRDGKVFISSGYRSGAELIQLTASGGQITARQLWATKDLDNHHGGVILLDGYLYGSDSRSKWICLDWDTGETMYEERGVGKGSLTYADGMLYTLAENGRKMGLVRATPEEHNVVSEFRIPEGGEGKSWAHPVVCGGRLYVRHGDFLYAFDIRAR